ncbi:YcfL family protein [Shewanella sp. 202IG2-18]|uniref:YcfL family protein n=1 Tax=Parashewanella hymeniacidonis TaxID=2807618 RepID=UPI001961D615|nr:YcfL family protein [Parashewanella hymeniacidonis]MBM7073705.1 YcfL family protein [Parashewanella hymeniacidonis]
MKKMIYALGALTMVSILSACAPNTSGVRLNSDGEYKVDNSFVGGDVTVTNNIIRQIGGLLQGAAKIVSHSSKDQTMEYRFTWFDNQGVAVDNDAQSWQPVQIHGKQSVQVMSVAPNSDAVRFQVYVRKVH